MTFGLRIVTVLAHMYGIHGTIFVVRILSIAAKQFVPRIAELSFEHLSASLSMLGTFFVFPVTPSGLHL